MKFSDATRASDAGRAPTPEPERPSLTRGDELFKEWLARPPARSPSSRPAASARDEPRDPLGDAVADRWFR